MRANQLALNESRALCLYSSIAEGLRLPRSGSDRSEYRDTRATQAPVEARPNGRGLLERFNHWLWTLHQRDIEAYLAKATDAHDLEVRIRELERNAPGLFD
jgi:hypothetical protein